MQLNFYYLSEDKKRTYEEIISTLAENKEKLKVVEVDDAIILPSGANGSIFDSSGGVLHDNKIVDISMHYRNNEQLIQDRIIEQKIEPYETRNKTAFFLGDCINQWGHFLLESITRLYPLINNINADYDYVFTGSPKGEFPQVYELLEIFGLKREQIIFIDKPTKYAKVIIPEQSNRLNGAYHKEYVDILNKIQSNVVPKQNKKIYLSRTKLLYDNVFGEDVIENIFKQNGYKIIYPERLSVYEQIAYIKGAEEIAGLVGSAMHSLVFARNDIKVHILNRSCEINFPQLYINKMKNFNTSIIKADLGFLPTVCGIGPFLVGYTVYFEQFLKQNNYKINLKRLNNFNNTMYEYIKYWLYKNGKKATDKTKRQYLLEIYKNSNIDLFADLIDNLDDASNLYGLYKKSAIYRIQKEFKRISFKLCNLKKKLINKY